ncbi:MAG: LytTR family DNA-binding domain-containing protein [Thermoanaerobaculia bacterium]|nr:LytTR family DNA-binding domain-containing protein [Thermoanaerobaculia bacterium]
MKEELYVLVVDDEPPARARLVDLLGSQKDVVMVREAADGVGAVRAILEHAPDLVFLDVQMPDLDGFGVLEALPEDCQPEVVFVTAFDSYALAAFDAAAVDYLLKPFSDERFAEAMARVRRILSRPRGQSRVRMARGEFLRALPTQGRQPLLRIPIQNQGRVVFFDVADIEWLEAEDVYVRLHRRSESQLLRSSLAGLMERLEPGRFVRIHRSVAISLDHLVAVHPLFRGTYELELRSGARVRSSRRYREAVRSLTRWD